VCGKLQVDLSVLAFVWETWDLGKVVDANVFVDVYANENTSGLIGLIALVLLLLPPMVFLTLLSFKEFALDEDTPFCGRSKSGAAGPGGH
jgi:hypothetical protein